jgi:hypothetical protein
MIGASAERRIGMVGEMAMGMHEAWRKLLAALVLACVAVLSVGAGSAYAEFGVEAFDGRVRANPEGGTFTQAGGHPFDVSTTILFNTETHPTYGPNWPQEPVKDIRVDLPSGLVGNPSGIAKCRHDQLAESACPIASQVGTATVTSNGNAFPPANGIYNMEAPPNAPARFAMNIVGTMVMLDAKLRSESDYGVSIVSVNTSEGLAVTAIHAAFWGVPADPRHDELRNCAAFVTGCSSDAPLRPFITNPTSCTPDGVGLRTGLSVSSWFDPSDVKTASFESHLPPGVADMDIRFVPLPPALPMDQWGPPVGITGCGDVPFSPKFAAAPSQPARAGSPSGFTFDLSIPQDGDNSASTIAQSHLRKAVVTLPEGVRVSPPSADGLAGCAPAQIGLESTTDPTCPAGSKIGSVQVDTPLLEEPLLGSVYLAKPHENPSGTLLGLYIVAKGPGVLLKLPGRVDVDPATGQATATFDNNPQLPFSKLHLALKDGPRAPLVNPAECGTYTTRAVLTGWNGKTVSSESSFTIDRNHAGGPCAPLGFSPDMQAGTSNPVAGGDASFSLSLARKDSDQELRSLTVSPPRGLLARLKGVAVCADAQAAAGTCAGASRVGSVMSATGAGSNPFWLPGRVYLAGPYKGAPYSLSVVVPAVAGPFDLGTVVVRAAIHVDRSTAALRVVSDPLPTILQGIPLQIRELRVDIDRPRFVINPTSCAEKRVSATVGSVQGLVANPSSRFEVGDCAALAFGPKLALRLTGRTQTRTGRHPGVKARVTQKGTGEAGIRQAVVRLPKALALDPANAKALCEFADGTKDDLESHCPKGSIVGRARATTPLLNRPLAGNVYFVKNVRRSASGNAIRTLPMLVVALRGQIAINLRGTSSTTKDGQLVNTFKGVPDAPIKRFDLNLKGGNSGILTITRTAKSQINLCAKPNSHIATAKLAGHNGKRHDLGIRVKTPCPTKRGGMRL